MLIFIIILLLIIFNGISAKGKNEFFDDYCARRQTSAINGIFAIIIFLSHSSEYIHFSSALDYSYNTMRIYMGQLVVVTFLFFSGFGMMESINKKGMDYIKSIPKNRLIRVWYHFALALLPYFLINAVLNRHYTTAQSLMAFTGAGNIGNSNWFMFVTFAMYIFVYISFILGKKSKVFALALVTIMALGFAVFEYKVGFKRRFYDTVMCFPAGMIYSLVKPYTDKILMKNDTLWACAFALFFGTFSLISPLRLNSAAYYTLWCLPAMILILLFSMKVQIANSILDWFGSHIFSIYMLQRIPMIILDSLGLSSQKYLFVTACFVITIVMVIVFDSITDKLDSLIFKSPKKTPNKI